MLRASSPAERQVWVERLTLTIDALRMQISAEQQPATPRGGIADVSRGALMEGFVKKKRAASKSQVWDKRYAVLTANALVYAEKKAGLRIGVE